MNIPPQADKWIAFVLIVGLGKLDYSRDGGFRMAPAGWLWDAVLIAVLLTILYVLWSALCLTVARRIRKPPPPGFTTRTVSNAIFGVFVTISFFWLYTPIYTTHARIWIPTSPDPVHDTPSQPPVK